MVGPGRTCGKLNEPGGSRQVGCDFLADIHGDEEIEYNFLAGNEGIPAWDDRLKRLQDEFCQAFLHTSPDFQMGCVPFGCAVVFALTKGARMCFGAILILPFKASICCVSSDLSHA